MRKREVALYLGLIGLALLLAGEPVAGDTAVSIELIRNGFALGVNNDACPQTHDPTNEPASATEWEYDQYISLSKCGNKNSHPFTPDGGGAMFKNGPTGNEGFGYPGIPAHMWQTYDLAALGISAGSELTLDIVVELISVGGTNFTAVIEASDDGQAWQPVATLIDWPQTSCGMWKYPLYCGTAVIPYSPYLRLTLSSVWVQQLGQKWVIHSLQASYTAVATATPTETTLPTETPTSTATMTPSPTAVPPATETPSATPAATYLPLILAPGAYELLCNGVLTISAQYAICEEGG